MNTVFDQILEYVDERLEAVVEEYKNKESILEDLENNEQPFHVAEERKIELTATLEELSNTRMLLGCMKRGIKSIISENWIEEPERALNGTKYEGEFLREKRMIEESKKKIQAMVEKHKEEHEKWEKTQAGDK